MFSDLVADKIDNAYRNTNKIMKILERMFQVKHQRIGLGAFFFGLLAILTNCNSDDRLERIPGKFIVVWTDSLHAPRFTESEKKYYDSLTLEINPDFTFRFNFDFEKIGFKEGEWKFDGPMGKKLLYLKYENESWEQVSTCLDTGWTFAYPIQVLDSIGNGRSLIFKKIANY